MFFGRKGQTDFIGNLLSIIPKPLLFIFFILLLSVLTVLLSPVFNSFGVFCSSDGLVVKVSESGFFSNIRLISSLPSADDIAGDSIDPNGLFDKCVEFVNGSYRLLNFGCSDCEVLVDYTSKINTLADVCVGDAFRTSDVNLSWYRRTVSCPLFGYCQIPKGYYFEFDSGLFECIGDCSSQTLAVKYDEKLGELGAVPYYSVVDDSVSYKGLFRFGCSESLRVEPTVKGVALFRLSYWAIIMLIGLLLWAIIRFGKK